MGWLRERVKPTEMKKGLRRSSSQNPFVAVVVGAVLVPWQSKYEYDSRPGYPYPHRASE